MSFRACVMRTLVATTAIVVSILLDLVSPQSLLAASSNLLLVGKAAYGDWRSDAPGIRRSIRVSDLPAPYVVLGRRFFCQFPWVAALH